MKKSIPWILWGLLVSLAASVAVILPFGVFRSDGELQQDTFYEQTDNMEWLYQSVYLLYEDLYNMQNGTHIDCRELYLQPDEEYKYLLAAAEEEGQEITGIPDSLSAGARLNEEQVAEVLMEIDHLENYFNALEKSFKDLNSLYHYCIRDDTTGKYLTNMSEKQAEALLGEDYSQYQFLMTFQFDEAGNVSIGNVCSRNEDLARKNANIVIRENTLSTLLASNMNTFGRIGSIVPPRNCTVIYGVTAGGGEAKSAGSYWMERWTLSGTDFSAFVVHAYDNDGYALPAYPGVLLLLLFMVVMLGMFLPVPVKTRPWEEGRLFAPPAELMAAAGILTVALLSFASFHIAFCTSEAGAEAVENYLDISRDAADVLSFLYSLAIQTCVFWGGWYVGVCARAVRGKGIRRYIKERSLIYRFFPFIRRTVLNLWRAAEHMDLSVSKKANRTMIRIVICNAIILFIICSLWYGGFLVTVIYSVLLYFILRKYISNLQKNYSILLKATNEMAEGNLNISIQQDIGVFEPFKPELTKIQNGFRKAVDEEVKSQKMKAELITNVSHDLKTPLTAIITYVNLLKEENITEEQRREYLSVLERKSLRLKALIEDLFEVSKANSQNITLNLADVDIMNLVKQVAFEMTDKLEEARLELRMNLTDERVLIPLDSQKTYRIYENLFGNIAKYAMKGTRVYVNGFRIDDTVVITLKNISAQELTVDSGDLTERFVRGDASRNTEGSGLGLAIARSFTELQGGTLVLEVDGDLFKVTTTWKLTGQNELLPERF